MLSKLIGEMKKKNFYLLFVKAYTNTTGIVYFFHPYIHIFTAQRSNGPIALSLYSAQNVEVSNLC